LRLPVTIGVARGSGRGAAPHRALDALRPRVSSRSKTKGHPVVIRVPAGFGANDAGGAIPAQVRYALGRVRAAVSLAVVLSISSAGCSVVSGRPHPRADREPGASRCAPSWPLAVDVAAGATAAALAVGSGVAARNNCPGSGSCDGWRTTYAVASASAVAFFLSSGVGFYLHSECAPLLPFGDSAGRALDEALARGASAPFSGTPRRGEVASSGAAVAGSAYCTAYPPGAVTPRP
jgi:hypothetical protein